MRDNTKTHLRIKTEDLHAFIAARLLETRANEECDRLERLLDRARRAAVEARERQLDLVEPVN